MLRKLLMKVKNFLRESRDHWNGEQVEAKWDKLKLAVESWIQWLVTKTFRTFLNLKLPKQLLMQINKLPNQCKSKPQNQFSKL